VTEPEDREPIVHKQPMAAIVSTSAVTMEPSVVYGLNGIRLCVLGILISIGLKVGFDVPGSIWIGPLAAAASIAIVSCLHWERPRSRLMALMHWLTGS